MSDFPSPPPPPPPGPPPPFVTYGTPAVAGWSKPVRGIAKALIVLQVLAVLGALAVVIATFAISDSAKDFESGASDDFENIGAFLAVVGIAGAISIAATVLLIVWSFRIASNIRLRDPSLTWKPGLTIVAWLLAGCFGILPFLMLREHWAKSSLAPRSGEASSPLIVTWLVLTICQVGTGIASRGVEGASGSGLGQGERDVAERVSDQLGLSIVSGVLAVASAAVLILIIRQLTDRHARFTGEA